MVLTPDKIEEFGRALYGPGWMGVLAKRLGTTKKTVQRWKSGKHNPPKDLLATIEQLVDDQVTLLCKIKDEIRDGW